MNLFNKPFLWAIIIFICAAIFRLTFLDLMEFKLDEARDVYEMTKFWQAPYLIQRGTIQSTGVYNPPLWYYILAVIALPSRDPQYLSFIIALINCAALAGLYWVIQKYYGQMVGVVSGLILTFSPWAILLSRKIWAPDLILPFLVIWLLFLHRLIIDKKPKAILGVVGMLGLLAQLHASGLFLASASITVITFKIVRSQALLITVIQKLKFSWKAALLGLLLSLIPLLPYIAYQFQTSCEDCQNFLSFQSEVKQFDVNVFLRPFQLINGSSFNLVLGEDYQNFLEQFPYIGIFNFIFLAEFILGISGIVYMIKMKKYLFLLTILGIIPALYLLTQTPSHIYYSLILAPLVAVVYAFSLKWFKKWVSITIITIIILINIIFELIFIQFLDAKGQIQGDFGPTFRVTKQQAEERLAKYKNNPNYELIKAEYYVELFNK